MPGRHNTNGLSWAEKPLLAAFNITIIAAGQQQLSYKVVARYTNLSAVIGNMQVLTSFILQVVQAAQ